MLVMRRRQGDSILIGDDIEIHLAHIGRNRVKIGIQAPKDVVIVAKEVRLVQEENKAAVQSPANHAVWAMVARVLARDAHPEAPHPEAPTPQAQIGNGTFISSHRRSGR